MKKTFLLLAMLAIVAGLSATDWSVALIDSYGDGWNGGLLTVYVNDTVVLDEITLDSGEGPEYHTFSVQNGDEISTIYTEGLWSNENYYAILNQHDDVVAESGGTWDNPGASTPESITEPLIIWSVALIDSYGDGWNGGLLTVYVNGDVVLEDITLDTGAGPEYHTFAVADGDQITTSYTEGSWSSENYYAIMDHDNEIVAESGGTWSNPGASTPESITEPIVVEIVDIVSNPVPENGAIGVALTGDLNWDFGEGVDTYDLWFGEAGNMVEVVSGETAGATGSYSYSDLDGVTVYEWQVIAHSAEENRLTTEGPVWSFTTTATPIIQFPWDEGFEDEWPPLGWTIVNGVSGSYWEQSSVSSNTGSYAARSYNGYSSNYLADEWLITPPINMDDGLMLSFFGYSSQTPNGDKEKMRIMIMDEVYDNVADLHANAIELDVKNFTGSWEEYFVNLDAYSGDKYIAFNYYIPVDVGYNYVYVDDVLLFELPDYDVSISNLTGDRTVQSGTTDSYEIEIENRGTQNDTYNINVTGIVRSWVYDFPATVAVDAGETAIVDLDVTVPADAGMGDTDTISFSATSQSDSNVSDSVEITTTAVSPMIAPHFEDFDDVSTPDLPIGWSKIVDHPTSTSPRVETYTSGTPLSPSNHVRLYSNDEIDAEIMLITPPTTGLNESRIRFWAKCSSTTNIPDLIIGTMSDPTDAATFTPFQIIEADTELTGTYQEFMVHFDSYVGTDQYVAFKHGATPSWFRSIYIDDFTYEEIPTDPVLEVSPMEQDFGTIAIGDMPDPVDCTLTNVGVGTLTINDGDILFTGADPDDFALGAITYPIEMESGNSQTIPIMFDPLTAGSKEAMMQITHNGTNSPFDVGPLSGYALPEGSLVEGFENEFPPESWTYIDGGLGSYWDQSSTSPYAGDYSARSYNGSGSSYDADEWLITPMLNLDATPDPSLMFAGRSGYDRPDPSMTIRIMMMDEVYDNVDDLHANAIEVGSIVLSAGWTVYEVDLAAYSGAHYFAFLYYVEDGSFNYVYVDEVVGPPIYVPPDFAYDPQEFDFGGLSVGKISEPQDFILSNIGGDVITIAPEDINLTGDTDHFILNNIEQTVNLGADESTVVSVQFAPQSLEEKTAYLNIEDNIAAERNIRISRADRNLSETGRELHSIPLYGEGLKPFRVERITPDEQIVIGKNFYYETEIVNDLETDELFYLVAFDGDWSYQTQNAAGQNISTINVPAEDTRKIFIRVTAPETAVEGFIDTFTFRAYSETNPDLTDEVDITSTAVELIELPYVQNFQSDEFPPDFWRSENWAWSATHGIAGSGAAIVPAGTEETAILRSKAINLPEGEKHVRFWWSDIDPEIRTRNASMTYLEIATQAEELPNAGTGDWTVLETLESGTYDDYTEMIVDLTAYDAGDYYLRWRHEPNGASPGAGLARVIIEANVPAAEFVIDPDAYDFGEVLVGESEIAQFTITNLGLETMTIVDGGIYIEALQRISRDQHYSVVHPNYPVELGYNQSLELEVVFEPLTDGIHEAELVIENNITRAVNRVPLTGEGYYRPAGSTCDNPYIATLPLVDYEDNTEAYGDDYSSGWINPSSSYLNGNDFVVQFEIDELGLFKGSVSGSWTGLFILDQCPSDTDPPDVLASATGSSGGSFSIEDLPIGTYYAIVSTWPSPQFTDFTLNLSLVTGPVFAADPPEKDFGQILVDATSEDQVFTISNDGIDTLIVNSIDLVGDDVAEFMLTDDNIYPIELGADENVTVSVAFAPTSEGIKTAMLEITEAQNAPDRLGRSRDTIVHQVPLTGEGYVLPENVVYFGTGDAVNSTTTANPINIYYRSLRGQMVYHATELIAAGIEAGDALLEFGFYVESPPLYGLPNFRIRMLHTDAEDSSAHIDVGPENNVYFRTEYMPTAGDWDILELDEPFVWDGVSNILVDTGFAQVPSWNSSGQQRIYTVPNGFRYIRQDAQDVSEEATTTTSSNKPQAIMIFGEIPQDGSIEGTVTMIGGEGDVTEVEVTAGEVTVNPEPDGTYSIEIAPGTYDVTAELFGYQTEVQYGVEVLSDETTADINFTLGNIGIAVDPSNFDVDITQGQVITQQMTITNNGAGDLEYEIGQIYQMTYRTGGIGDNYNVNVEKQIGHNSELDERAPNTMSASQTISQQSRELFDLLYHFPTGTGLGYSVATDGYYIYSAMWNNNLFYKYETDGTYVGEFSVPGFDGNLRDMTFDGQYFYGSPNSDTIYQLDLVDEILVDQFTTGVSTIRGLAYDEINDGFWVTNGWNPPITLVDRTGSTIQTIDPAISSISGLGWENKSNGGPHLWAYTQPGAPSDNVLNKIKIEDESIAQTFDVAELGILDEDSISGGMDIASETGAYTIIGMSQNDMIWILDLESWLSIEPIAGTVPAGQSVVVDLMFDASKVDEAISYSADIVVSNNAQEDPIVVPATMNVEQAIGASVPYVVDFEAEFPPVFQFGPDWQRMSGAVGTTLQSTIYGWQQMDYANLGEGNMSAGIQMYDNNLNHWLITSPIYLDNGAQRNEGVYRLNFDLALTQFNSSAGASLAEGDIFRVYVSTDDGATWDMLKEWDHTTAIPADGEPQLILLEEHHGETVKFGFYAESDIINDVELFVDNFAVHYVGEAIYDIYVMYPDTLAHNFERVTLGETEAVDINLDLTEGTLIINNIELSGENADEFIIPQLHYPMTMEESAALPVTFAPVELGLKSAQIDIEIYDPYAVAENGEYYTYEIMLEGVGYEEPTITPPEQISFAENDEWVGDFTDYITGITPGGELPDLTVELTEDIIVTIDGYEVTLSAPDYWNGLEDVTFIVDDQFNGLRAARNSEYARRENPLSRATDSFTINVEVTPVNNPPFVLDHVADFEIDINEIDDVTVNVWDVFDDWDLHPELNNHPDAPDEELSFSTEGNVNIAVDIDPISGVVTFTPAADWYGAEDITLIATDIAEQTAETTFTVTVPNEPPYVTDLTIEGWVKVEQTLTASYTFNDPDGHAEGESVYQWYRQPIVRSSRNEWTPIEGANELEYTLTTEDGDKLVAFGVTPVDEYGLAGDEVMSVVGPVTPLSDDATLAEITVDEVPIVGFAPDIYEYTMYYSFGTTEVPVVDAVANCDFADIVITEATEMPFNHHEEPTFTTIDVYAEDSIHELTYTVYFAIAPADNANLASISLEYGMLDPTFDPDITEYTGILPYDSTVAPEVTATTQDPGATHTVTQATDLEDTTVIHVTSLDGTVEKYYYVDYMLEPSLATLEVSMGELEPEFDPGIDDYNVVLPFGTTEVPAITATATLEGSTIEIIEPTELPERHFEDAAMAYVEVTHPEGYPTNIYSVAYSIAPNTVATLDDIEVDGVSIPDFDPDILEYTIELPFGTTDVPQLTVYPTDEYATYEITDAEEMPERWFEDAAVSTVEVTAEDGETVLIYTVNFAILPNTVATLDDIEVDGESIPDFDPDVLEYDLYYTYGTMDVPEVVAHTTDPYAASEIFDAVEMPGTTEIEVIAEDGETELTYMLNFIWEENQAPYIENLVITGYHKVGYTLTAEYDFLDPDGHAEGETLYQWYVSAPASREPMTPIEGAVEDTFIPTMDYVGMNILVEVTPVDEWGLAGEAVMSPPTDPIIPLDPPRNLVANAGDEYVDLMWQAPVTTRGEGRRNDGRISDSRDYRDDHAVIGYNIYRDEELITTVGLVHNYRDEDVENVVEYSYYITALYPAGESFPSNADTAMPMPDIIPYGDVDNNGVVEAFDAALTLQYAVGLDPLPEDPRPWEDWRLERADVDANSQIQAYDASLIIRYALGIITEFPAQQEPGRLADPIYVDISYATEDGYLYFVTNAMEDLFAAEFIIPHPANVSFGEVEFNPILADYITAIHTDDQGIHIAMAAAIPEEGSDYLLRIPYEQEDYELLTIDVISNIHQYSMEIEFDPTESDDPITPVNTMLSQNYPNPFNPNTTIAFALESQQHVCIEVYSIKGNKVATLIDKKMDSGYHTVNWNGTDDSGRTLASGIYLYRMVTAEFTATKKMIYLK